MIPSLAAFLVLTIGPGLWLGRRLPVPGALRPSVIIAVSLGAVAAGAWSLYLAAAPLWLGWGLTAVSAVAASAARRDLGRLLRRPLARMQFIGFATVVIECLLLHAAVFSYHGGCWSGDWLEHYERSLFFLDRPDPLSAQFLVGTYSLPARPPAFNLLAGLLMAHGARDFAAYQVVATLLNCLACLPMWAIGIAFMRSVRVPRRHGLPAIVAATLLAPVFIQNAIFPWTKLFTAFFVLTGLALVAVRGPRASARLALAGGCFGLAISAHYSAAVYAVVAAGFLGAQVLRRRVSAPGLVAFGVAAAAATLPWLAYAATVFGWQAATSTTAVSDAARLTPFGNVVKVLLNIRDTLLPHFLRPRPPLVQELMEQTHPLAPLRDYWFLPLQQNFPWAAGTLAPLVAGWAWLAGGGVAKPGRGARDSVGLSGWYSIRDSLWAWVLLTGVPLGIAVHGGRDTLGLAHICLQPAVLVAIAWLVSRMPLVPAAVRVAAYAGSLFDAAVGIALQVILEHEPIGLVIRHEGGRTLFNNDVGLYAAATLNLSNKLHYRFPLLADQFGGSLPLGLGLTGLLVAFVVFVWQIEAARGRRAHAP
jgi:hypothetical protein